MVAGLHAGVDDIPEGAVLPRTRQLRPAGAHRQGAGHGGAVRVFGQIQHRAGSAFQRHPVEAFAEAVGAFRAHGQPAFGHARGARLPRQAAALRPLRSADGARGHGASLLSAHRQRADGAVDGQQPVDARPCVCHRMQ